MTSPEISIGCVANLFSRMMLFARAGDVEVGHTHQFDHLTLLAKGLLKVTVNEQVSYFSAPHMIFIHKNYVHQLEALEDNTVAYCIHVLRTEDQSEILDPSMVPIGVPTIYNAGVIRGNIAVNPQLDVKPIPVSNLTVSGVI